MFTQFNKCGGGKVHSQDLTSFLNPRFVGAGYMLLSDGCSTSIGDVILGARIYHRFFGSEFLVCNCFYSIRQKVSSMISNFSECIFNSGISFDQEDFLVTSLSCIVNPISNSMSVAFHGDGYFYIEDHLGNFNIIGFTYENNTPLYIAYTEELAKNLKISMSGEFNLGESFQILDNNRFVAEIDYSKIKKFFMFSDGVEQIEGFSAEEFIKEVCQDSKLNVGDPNFSARKANHILKNKKLGDDVSFVGFVK